MNPSASPIAPSTVDSPLVAAVQAAIAQYGPSLLFEPVRLAEILSLQYPAPAPAVSLLLRALDDNVPQQLLGAHTSDELGPLIVSLVERLAADRSLSPAEARWAVETWALILQVVPVVVVPAEPVIAPPSTPATAALQDRGAPPRKRAAVLVMALLLTCVVGGAVWFHFFHRSLAITSLVASGPLVGDGSKHDVRMGFTAHNLVAQGVEVRFVRGDVFGDERPLWIAIDAAAAEAKIVVAGQIGLASTRPSRATFSYVLVGADGTRSAPVEKTFDFSAGPVRPPVIRSVAVPGELVTGKPFALTIAFDAGTGLVGTVEMKIADQRAEANAQTVTTRLADLPPSQPGTLLFPLEPVSTVSRRIADFTLVDADGHRSEPARVVLDVRKPGFTPDDCTTSTCGRVLKADATGPKPGLSGFLGRLFDPKESAKKVYLISVRFDDGSTRVLQASSRWNPGARVHVAGRTARLRCIEPDNDCR